jgi:hypothetical protein
MTDFLGLLNRDFIRSIRGQLALLGVTYIGAAGLAVVALIFRTSFFEYHVRERYPEPSARILAMIERGGRASASDDADALERLSASELDAAYGAWISDPAADPTGQTAVRVLWGNPDALIRRLRMTAVAGNLEQRRRALALLSYAKPEARDEAIALCRFLAERARRRGEWALVDEANHVLGRFSSTS